MLVAGPVPCVVYCAGMYGHNGWFTSEKVLETNQRPYEPPEARHPAGSSLTQAYQVGTNEPVASRFAEYAHFRTPNDVYSESAASKPANAEQTPTAKGIQETVPARGYCTTFMHRK